MARTTFATVTEYIVAQPPAAQAALFRVRAVIRKAIPAADESISYGMPTYKLSGRPVVYFAGWKQHWSLYPATPGLLEALGDELAPYEVSKGTIRFPLPAPPPAALIARIVTLRAKEALAATKGGSRKARTR